MEKGEFELAQILLFPILKLVLSQPLLHGELTRIFKMCTYND
jgi:hypothetical protein